MLDLFLLILALLLLIIGMIGSVLPVIPGPPIGFLGLLCAHFSTVIEFTPESLVAYGIFSVGITILDFFIPAYGAKKFGGTRYGIWGTTIGLMLAVFVFPVLGIVLGPFGLLGIILFPFLGALSGEFIGGKESQEAFRAAIGSFIGFLSGTLIKLGFSLYLLVLFSRKVIGVFFA